MSKYIQKLIEQGEHLRQDFKFEIHDVRKIAKEILFELISLSEIIIQYSSASSTH